MQLQTTINSDIMTVFNNGEQVGEIAKTKSGFEARHSNGLTANFATFEAAKKLFEEVIKPTIKRNNQLNLF